MRTFEEYTNNYSHIVLQEGKIASVLSKVGVLGSIALAGLPGKLVDKVEKYNGEKEKPVTVVLDKKHSLRKHMNVDTSLPMKYADKSKKQPASSKSSVEQSTLDLLKSLEGFYSNAYDDGFGNVTIGYGFTKNIIPKLKFGDTITRSQADDKIFNVLKNIYEPFVNNNVHVPISQKQFDALVSWTYNVGRPSAKRSSLLKKLNNSEYKAAAQEFLKWNRVRGRFVKGLSNRREKERSMFLADIS